MRELVIDHRRIADDTPGYVIAELGNNHGGSLDQARALLQMAAEAGVDAVKFQKRETDRLYTSALLAAPYDHEHSYGPTYGAHRRALELSEADLACLFDEAIDHGVTCFATAFDEWSVDALMRIGVPAIKIHSGGIADIPLLTHAAHQGVPLIVSTGGASLDTIDRAHGLLADAGAPHALLHCTAAYPLKPAQANLRVIETLRARYPDTVIGFSSHATGIAWSLVAAALGARILEHHVTLDRGGKGTDHGFSLEPKGLRTLVDDLAKLHTALGDGVKRVYASEAAPLAKMTRRETPEGWKIG
jgi:N-acetylneuraminate synthase/sialic acid synthase